MRFLGLDGGIASLGWAVIEWDSSKWQGEAIAAGVWKFNSPEEQTQSGPKLKNAERRTFRGQRRVIRRRKQRMAALRKLFLEQGLLESAAPDALAGKGKAENPWDLRAAGLDRRLTAREWALALGHIAIHRGFRSNRKGERKANKKSESSKMLGKIEELREKLGAYRTVGEMMAKEPEFQDRKRNRDANFDRSLLRDDQEDEVKKLFAAQARLGNKQTSAAFQERYSDLAFSQRPLQSSESLVGFCPFEEEERRAARFSPGFERFRLLSSLNNLRLREGMTERPLREEERALALKDYAKTKSFTFAKLRKQLKLGEEITFSRVTKDQESKQDVTSKSGNCFAGTRVFLDCLAPVLGELEMTRLLVESEPLDRAAEVLTFNEDLAVIAQGLEQLDLPEEARRALIAAAEEGDFDHFKGAAHISAKAARKLIPALEQGLVYSEACTAVGYNHSAQKAVPLSSVTSPVARKALSEMLKQIKVLEASYGPFDRVHVEMARDIGKSLEERGFMEAGIRRRTKDKEKAREDLAELLGLPLEKIGSEDLLRYELWKEQQGRCLYSGKAIEVKEVAASSNLLQVDHIFPWSRCGDNGFFNKTLCYSAENQRKKNRTPFEYFQQDKPQDWPRFQADVEACTQMKGAKRRHYQRMNAEEVEKSMRDRNLNDTRYALRALISHLLERYPNTPEGERRVFARPGRLTALLRRAWGLQAAKFDAEGERIRDERHHALDALVTAATSERLLQLATQAAQEAEKRGEKDVELRGFAPPWPGFRQEVLDYLKGIFVARAEVGRQRGKLHDATINQLREQEGEERVYTRKAVNDLTLGDLDLIPRPEPYGKIADPGKLRDILVENLRAWIEAGKPKDQQPRSHQGDVIRRVRLLTNKRPAVKVRKGNAERGNLIRTDVFTKLTPKGKREYFLVPIYNYQLALMEQPPNKAMKKNGDEANWIEMTEDYQFLWSLYPGSYFEAITEDGEVRNGYLRSVDRDSSRLLYAPPEDFSKTLRCSPRSVPSFKKFHVDRLGNRYEIKQETRTWRGKVCT